MEENTRKNIWQAERMLWEAKGEWNSCWLCYAQYRVLNCSDLLLMHILRLNVEEILWPVPDENALGYDDRLIMYWKYFQHWLIKIMNMSAITAEPYGVKYVAFSRQCHVAIFKRQPVFVFLIYIGEKNVNKHCLHKGWVYIAMTITIGINSTGIIRAKFIGRPQPSIPRRMSSIYGCVTAIFFSW